MSRRDYEAIADAIRGAVNQYVGPDLSNDAGRALLQVARNIAQYCEDTYPTFDSTRFMRAVMGLRY